MALVTAVVPVLVEDSEHHAVWVKPAGMIVVAGRGVPRPTLLDVAVERFGVAKPVHRLDRVTTGLCIIAKTSFGQSALNDAFRRHLVDKRYLAIVAGTPSWDKIDIDARLQRIDDPDARKGPLAIQTIADDGIRALTRVRVLARSATATLVEARPETGRMHQIRCHLAHVGFPIIGDSLYGSQHKFVVEGAVALFAAAVSFPRPGGGRSFCVLPHVPLLSDALAAHQLPMTAVRELLDRFMVQPVAAPSKPVHLPTSKAARPRLPEDPTRRVKKTRLPVWPPVAPTRHTQRRKPPR
jgi:RluA family pseudouridine synthase